MGLQLARQPHRQMRRYLHRQNSSHQCLPGSHVNEGIKQVAAGVVVEAVCEVWCVHRASCMCVSVCLRARVWRGGVLCVVLCCVWQGPAIEDPNAIFTADARCLARKAVAGAVDSWLAAKLRQATAM
eukprot:GGOE01034718.1.p5 GENE.GGOE01034718.1~~GGOE01034718.1.p5  ORF type:complete len:127 (-),score=11.14 GGOE01034718.1:964-1344(-)